MAQFGEGCYHNIAVNVWLWSFQDVDYPILRLNDSLC